MGLDALRERLEGNVSVLVGHSGVGKSTLLKAVAASPRSWPTFIRSQLKGRH